MKGHRVQLTVRLEPQVMQAARQRAGEMKRSLSATVAEAAKESLLSSYRSEREQAILKAADRNFHALRRFERQLRCEVQVLKEMIGVGMRSFFNHTTPIPESAKNAALRSGKERFGRYLDVLAANLRSGESILRDLPLPESDEQKVPASPSANGGAAARIASSDGEAANGSTNQHSDEGAPVHTVAPGQPDLRSRGRGEGGLFEENITDD